MQARGFRSQLQCQISHSPAILQNIFNIVLQILRNRQKKIKKKNPSDSLFIVCFSQSEFVLPSIVENP